MILSKKKYNELLARIEQLEAGRNKITTAQCGSRSVRWYIRMLAATSERDKSKDLESWDD